MPEHAIRDVHVIFKTHLDIGFTQLAARVLHKYVHHFIPQALKLARDLRERGGPERFVWTTGSFLIHHFLEEADSAGRRAMDSALAAGDIAWHALPFTTHTELLDAALLRHGLSLSQELDRRYGRKTIAAKLTDVPGHTRALVSLLAEAGVRFLHIGVNPASTPPRVPPLFRWRNEQSHTEVVVMYQTDYGATTVLPDGRTAFALLFTGDNKGPQTLDAVLALFATLREQFPAAQVRAATLNDVANALEPSRGDLPVVTSELGDTWIHGAGTDPAKVAAYRELLRLRRAWLDSGTPAESLRSFSNQLLMIPEHTWGMDEKTHLADPQNFTTPAFRRARRTTKYRAFEKSWAEQRACLTAAVKALPTEKLRREATKAVRDSLHPRPPRWPNSASKLRPNRPIALAGHELVIGAQGEINGLRLANGKVLADQTHPLALLRYEAFGAADYRRYQEQYLTTRPDWALADFGKPGLEKVLQRGHAWQPRLIDLTSSENTVRAVVAFPRDATTRFGAPPRVELHYTFQENTPQLQLSVYVQEKPACRIPEALWVSFVPRVAKPQDWLLEKLGEPVSPLDVVRDGNRQLHAVGAGARNASGKLELQTIDAPLIAPGAPSLLNFHARQPKLRNGLHVNLLNNVWGTNFPMWIEGALRYRFALRCGTKSDSAL